jgi:hypothetical protein
LVDSDSIDDIASDFGLSRADLIRHGYNHILSRYGRSSIDERRIFCYYCKRPMEEKLFMEMVLKGDRFYPTCNGCLEPEDYWRPCWSW